MDENYPVRDLLDAVIKMAVHDRRKAVTDGLLDENCNPIRRLKRGEAEMVANLQSFFDEDGLEIALELAGYRVSAAKIRRRSNDPYD